MNGNLSFAKGLRFVLKHRKLEALLFDTSKNDSPAQVASFLIPQKLEYTYKSVSFNPYDLENFLENSFRQSLQKFDKNWADEKDGTKLPILLPVETAFQKIVKKKTLEEEIRPFEVEFFNQNFWIFEQQKEAVLKDEQIKEGAWIHLGASYSGVCSVDSSKDSENTAKIGRKLEHWSKSELGSTLLSAALELRVVDEWNKGSPYCEYQAIENVMQLNRELNDRKGIHDYLNPPPVVSQVLNQMKVHLDYFKTHDKPWAEMNFEYFYEGLKEGFLAPTLPQKLQIRPLKFHFKPKKEQILLKDRYLRQLLGIILHQLPEPQYLGSTNPASKNGIKPTLVLTGEIFDLLPTLKRHTIARYSDYFRVFHQNQLVSNLIEKQLEN